MNRRADSRIEMKLPCRILFPQVWEASVEGVTANLHAKGVLLACNLKHFRRELPAVGDKARVQIVLPPNERFPRKCMDCESVLVRVRQLESGEWLFALRIQNVNFDEWIAENLHLLDRNDESCRYLT